MKLIILGKDGQLGSDFIKYGKDYGYETIGLSHKEIEVSDANSINSALSKYNFDGIINTTAYHGVNAYSDLNPIKHYSVNAYGPYFLAQYAEKHKKYFVHYSTDYVFSGNNKSIGYYFSEYDLPIPANLYAASKYAGENLIQITSAKYLICRVASIYGENGCKAKGFDNFVEMIIRKYQNGEILRIVDDIQSSPTSTIAIIKTTLKLIKLNCIGLYHISGQGSCSWYEFAKQIFSNMGYSMNKLERVTTKEVKQEIKRGCNTSLQSKKLLEIDIYLNDWEYYLKRYIEKRNK